MPDEIPRDFWRVAPCGHPPDPVAAWTGHGPVCHCGWCLDGASGMEVEGAPGPVVLCQKCGCNVAIPPAPAPVGEERGEAREWTISGPSGRVRAVMDPGNRLRGPLLEIGESVCVREVLPAGETRDGSWRDLALSLARAVPHDHSAAIEGRPTLSHCYRCRLDATVAAMASGESAEPDEDRGELGRKLEQMVAKHRSGPPELVRAAASAEPGEEARL